MMGRWMWWGRGDKHTMPGVYTTSKDDTHNTCILTLLSLKNAPIFPQPRLPVHLVNISEGIIYGTVSKYNTLTFYYKHFQLFGR